MKTHAELMQMVDDIVEYERARQREDRVTLDNLNPNVRAVLESALSDLYAGGEAVALPEPMLASLVSSSSYCHGYNTCLDELAKFGPLYTRPQATSAEGISDDALVAAYLNAHMKALDEYTKANRGCGMQSAIDAGILAGVRAIRAAVRA